MDELLKKISSYNFFNYLFPGILYAYLTQQFISIELVQQDLLMGFFVYYFLGLIISRIGSFFIEPIIKKYEKKRNDFTSKDEWRKWKDETDLKNYEDFIFASERDGKIELFSEINNMYRSLCSMIIIVLITIIYDSVLNRFSFLSYITPYLFLVAILIILVFSYKKQTKYIRHRIKIQKK